MGTYRAQNKYISTSISTPIFSLSGLGDLSLFNCRREEGVSRKGEVGHIGKMREKKRVCLEEMGSMAGG